jgi:hypothetical protein
MYHPLATPTTARWTWAKMGKSYYFFGQTQAGVQWEKHAWDVQQKGVDRSGADQTSADTQVVYNQEGRETGRRRTHRDAAIGIDSTDAHMGGDRVVVEAEIPDGKGDITQVVHRYSDSGRISSYEVQWVKVAEGRHVLARTRRTSS